MAKIVNIEIVGEETKENSGIARALVGGLLFGSTGAIVGATTARDKKYTSFRVTYKNGKTEILKFKNGFIGYQSLLKLMQKGYSCSMGVKERLTNVAKMEERNNQRFAEIAEAARYGEEHFPGNFMVIRGEDGKYEVREGGFVK